MADERRADVDLKVSDGTILFVRAGGVALLAALIFPVVGVIAVRSPGPIVGLGIANVLLFSVGLWATRTCFVARGHRSATRSVSVAILGLSLALGFLGWVLLVEGVQPVVRNRFGGPWAWLILLPIAAAQVALIVVAARAIGFARYGGPIWMAAGVLNIMVASTFLGASLIVLASVIFRSAPGGFGMLPVFGLFAVVAVLVYPAALICHAIALFKAAGQLKGLRALGAAFE